MDLVSIDIHIWENPFHLLIFEMNIYQFFKYASIGLIENKFNFSIKKNKIGD